MSDEPVVVWGRFGTIGGLFLAAYLLIVGISALVGGVAIPPWAIGLFATAAGVLLLIGR